MSKIMVKLKDKEVKDFLIAASGTIIDKKEFVEVDEEDGFVRSYVMNGKVEVKDVDNNVEEKSKSKNKD